MRNCESTVKGYSKRWEELLQNYENRNIFRHEGQNQITV